MRTPYLPRRSSQAGQSMTEFVVALVVLVPLFLAVAYAGKYGDLQSAANQASRYAAFQRAIEPEESRLAGTKIEDQMRRRFFVDGKYKDGKLRSDDSAVPLKKEEGLPALWRDASFGALLQKLDDVKLTWAAGSMRKPPGLDSAAKLTTLENTTRGAHVANVEISLINKMDQASGKPELLRIAAATAAVGDRWASSGNGHTDSTTKKLLFSDDIALIGDAMNVFLWVFEGDGHDIELGCVKSDTVPRDRLEGSWTDQGC